MGLGSVQYPESLQGAPLLSKGEKKSLHERDNQSQFNIAGGSRYQHVGYCQV